MRKKLLLSIFLLGFTLTMVLPTSLVVLANVEDNEPMVSPTLLEQPIGAFIDVLIQTKTQNYESVITQINAYGGEVKHEFAYASGLAARIPTSLLTQLKANGNIEKISLDELRYPAALPSSPTEMNRKPLDEGSYELKVDDQLLTKMDLTQLESVLATSDLETYWNFLSMGAVNVWGTGNEGQGSLAVIIDTGVYADHVMLGWADDPDYPGPVIGGIDLTHEAEDPTYGGFSNPNNHWHGTHVAGILAGSAWMLRPEGDYIADAYIKYTGLYIPAPDIGGPEGYVAIPLLGMAPGAQIYGIKIFDHTGSGVPESEVIASIEYAINMHVSGDYDVDIISMSLGGGTGFDGRDLEDQTVDYATSVGITVVTSSGNAGPASLTIGSPGTANTAISVGAVNHPINTKIFYDAIYGIGDYVFTGDTPQIIYFSSRGPTSDGRNNPTLSATGFWVLSAATPSPGSLMWAGGTSMACPAVSGAVALMNAWNEYYEVGASPYDYKEALIDGAIWLEGFDKYDQGAGFLNAYSSLISLMNDPSYGDDHPGIRRWYRHRPVRPKGINTHIYGSGEFEYTFDHLEPGLAVDFYFVATKRTSKITIEFTDFETGLDPIYFNALELYLQSAVRSDEDYFIDSLIFGDAIFEFSDYSTLLGGAVYPYVIHELPLQPGYMRIVVQTAWDSYDWCSGKMKITVEEDKPFWCNWWNYEWPDEVFFGFFETGDETGFFSVGYGASGVKLETSWYRDWTRYPTSDLDMIILWSDGTDVFIETSGASLRSPEGVLISSSDIQWVDVLIAAYSTYDRIEPWMLKVYYLD